MMRNILKIWFFLAVATFAAASCHEALDIPESPELPTFEADGIVLKLDVGKMDINTRVDAGTRPGDDDGNFNENILGSAVDIFFFPEGATDASESNFSCKATVSSITGGGFVSIPVNASKIATIFDGTAPGNECVVYVVANYNGSVSFNHESGSYTLGYLKALPLAVANWSSFPQEKFVMTGQANLRLEDASASTPASGTIDMKRVAAKVTFKLTVADTIVVENVTRDQSGNITKKTLEKWAPQKDAMTVYLQYAMKYATLGGTPYKVPIEPKSQAATDSLYTYSENKLAETTQTISRQRTIIDRLVEPETEGGEWELVTHEEQLQVPVYATKVPNLSTDGPFYSYPVTWDPGVQTEPFLKLIIPWKNGGRTRYYYYKIPFAVDELISNNWYEITLDVQILGGDDEQPIPLEAKYKIVDWVPGSTTQAGVVSARYLSVPTKLFTMYNIEELKIPMLSSHECEIVNIQVTKPHYGSGSEPTYSASSLQKLEINAEHPLEEIDFEHQLNNNMGRNLDCAPYTITFTVRQKSDHDYSADVTIVQYPAIYIEKSAGGKVFVDGYYTLVTGGKPDQNANTRTSGNTTYYYHGGSFNPFNDGTRITPYGNLNGGTASSATIPTSETENTKIHVTAFAEGSETYTFNNRSKSYIIGDPRVPFMESASIRNKTITNYLTPGGRNNATTAWTQDQLNALMVGTDVDNIIAPSFMFASEWGRQGTGESSFETVAHRCATYQEAGYPAGRWRLPTEAEVAFVANLQANNFIGTLFAGGQYWISNGTAVSVSGSNVTPRTSGNSTRCVYDIWYWGEDPVVSPDYMYAVMP